jgi:hypothetical protein
MEKHRVTDYLADKYLRQKCHNFVVFFCFIL